MIQELMLLKKSEKIDQLYKMETGKLAVFVILLQICVRTPTRARMCPYALACARMCRLHKYLRENDKT